MICCIQTKKTRLRLQMIPVPKAWEKDWEQESRSSGSEPLQLSTPSPLTGPPLVMKDSAGELLGVVSVWSWQQRGEISATGTEGCMSTNWTENNTLTFVLFCLKHCDDSLNATHKCLLSLSGRPDLQMSRKTDAPPCQTLGPSMMTTYGSWNTQWPKIIVRHLINPQWGSKHMGKAVP